MLLALLPLVRKHPTVESAPENSTKGGLPPKALARLIAREARSECTHKIRSEAPS